MVVRIRVKPVRSYRVASMLRVGPYSSNMLRAEFTQLKNWAKRRELRTGTWFLYFIDEPGGRRPANKLRSEACLEIKGKAVKSEGKVKVKKLPKQTVASVTFNPDKISPSLVYAGIWGWIQWRNYKAAGLSREVYSGSPWKDKRAWANTEVQLPIKRKRRK
jgi:effector-binding domain-containing protein